MTRMETVFRRITEGPGSEEEKERVGHILKKCSVIRQGKVVADKEKNMAKSKPAKCWILLKRLGLKEIKM